MDNATFFTVVNQVVDLLQHQEPALPANKLDLVAEAQGLFERMLAVVRSAPAGGSAPASWDPPPPPSHRPGGSAPPPPPPQPQS